MTGSLPLPSADGRVLVTGAGGPAGVSVLRALRDGGRETVACDADPLAVGLRLADDSAVLPPSHDPTYVDQVCRLAEKTRARVLVSTIAEEMPVLASAHTTLENAGLASWLPAPDAVMRCTDKWQFAAAACRAGVCVPKTGLGSAADVPAPWVVKPRFGRGSRDVHMAGDGAELRVALARVPDALVQTRLHGREFTVDVLTDRDGNVVAAVPRWRLETRGGISVKGETFENRDVVAGVRDVIAAVGLVGIANVQGFVDDNGDVTFIEANPRFSGGLSLSIAAGADLVGEYVRGVEGRPLRPERLGFRAGVRMLRHFAEVYEG